MAKIYTIKSPAKVNIGLRVLSKRPDRFHNIETIFYPVKIFDKITLKISKLTNSKANAISIKTDSASLQDKKNICYKAITLFFDEFKIKDKYKIEIKIKKNIPIGAGLGGGSSNAASVLKILIKHFGNDNLEKLKKISLKLGSDVPFFLHGKASYASSRGEKLTPLPKFKIPYKILIVNSGIHVSTKWAYKELKVKKTKSKILNKVKTFNPSDMRLMLNDFERAVFRKFPKIEKIKYEMFRHRAVYALMSGSGSTVYGFFTAKNIKASKKYFSGPGYKTFTA